MASLYQLKPAFQNVLRPLVAALARIGVTPNQVTLLALAMSVAMGALMAVFPTEPVVLLLLPLAMFMRMALNAIDGMLARELSMQTTFGGFLNELSDVASDCAMMLPFVLILPQAAVWVVLLTVFAVLGEFAGVVAQALGGSRRYDGPMGKSDRAFLFGLIALLLGAGVAPGSWCVILVAAGCALAVVTLFRRIKRGAMEIDAIKNNRGVTGA
jgi:CDP-diacylglycerol---glycerol-3-phosphate 3-phosphatidyltransferase